MTIRVVLVDDQELVRTGFRMVLDAQPDTTVVGEAGDGAAAIRLLRTCPADVVLMDVRMPGMNGVEATRQICTGPSHPSVLILTTFDLDEYAFSALRAGASGFLLKDVPPPELLSAIRAVHSGDAVVAPSTTRRLIDRFVPLLPEGNRSPVDLGCLTEREREVLTHIARGLSNAEIATTLYVSEATVKTHVGRILAKLGLRDRVQAVVLAYESGLVRARPRPLLSACCRPVQGPRQGGEDEQREQPPRVGARGVDPDRGEREPGRDQRRHVPVVADHEVVPERADGLQPPHGRVTSLDADADADAGAGWTARGRSRTV